MSARKKHSSKLTGPTRMANFRAEVVVPFLWPAMKRAAAVAPCEKPAAHSKFASAKSPTNEVLTEVSKISRHRYSRYSRSTPRWEVHAHPECRRKAAL